MYVDNRQIILSTTGTRSKGEANIGAMFLVVWIQIWTWFHVFWKIQRFSLSLPLFFLLLARPCILAQLHQLQSQPSSSSWAALLPSSASPLALPAPPAADPRDPSPPHTATPHPCAPHPLIPRPRPASPAGLGFCSPCSVTRGHEASCRPRNALAEASPCAPPPHPNRLPARRAVTSLVAVVGSGAGLPLSKPSFMVGKNTSN
jgi:hypothetical protein